MTKGKEIVVCRDESQRRSRCPCLPIGANCTTICRCSNCGNNGNSPDKKSPNVTGHKRNRRNPQTYKRMRGADFLASKEFEVSNGPWTNLETIILYVVTEVIEDSGVPSTSLNIADLFNFGVSSEKMKEIGLAVTYKPFSSIAGKFSHLNDKHFLYESLMDSS